jgi:pimeloyl-ACP methyl ester carboxylesterase
VLLVRGDADDGRSQTMRAAADEMRAYIRNLRIVTVPGAGHMVHHEEPEILARHILDFDRAFYDGGVRAAQPPKP